VFGTNFVGWDAPEKIEHAAHARAMADNARRLLRKTGTAAPRAASA
jgi:hypothetical protein